MFSCHMMKELGELFFKWKLSLTVMVFLQIMTTVVSTLKLPEDYHQSLRPNNEAVADYVKVAVQLVSVRNVGDNQVTVDLILRKQWTDPRLASLVSREQTFSNKLPEIWLPDLFIINSISSKQPEEHSSGLRITSDGSVNHDERLTVTLNCPMKFAKFPFDSQDCQLTLSSFSYTKVHLDLIWHGLVNDNTIVYDSEYSISNVEQSSRNIRTKEGEYAHLTLSFTLSRCGLSYVFRTLIPTLIFAAFSYATLFSPSKSGNEVNLTRLALNALLLVLIVFISQLNVLNTPPAAVITASDVWMFAVCIIVILVFSLSFLRVLLKWRRDTDTHLESSETELSKKSRRGESLLDKIEHYLKLSIPIIFLLFVIIYFAVYLS